MKAEAKDSDGNVLAIETDAGSVFIETKGRVSIGDKIDFLRRVLDWLEEHRPTMTAEDVKGRVRQDTTDRDVDRFLPPAARRYSDEATSETQPAVAAPEKP